MNLRVCEVHQGDLATGRRYLNPAPLPSGLNHIIICHFDIINLESGRGVVQLRLRERERPHCSGTPLKEEAALKTHRTFTAFPNELKRSGAPIPAPSREILVVASLTVMLLVLVLRP